MSGLICPALFWEIPNPIFGNFTFRFEVLLFYYIQAIAYTKAMGVDVDKMIETIKGGAAGSWQLSNLGPKMAAGDYAPGFYIKHIIKDMRIADEEAEEKNLVLPVLQKVCEMYQELEKQGKGENGTQGLIEYYL